MRDKYLATGTAGGIGTYTRDSGGAAWTKAQDVSGTVTISPNTGVTTGTQLTATYSGSEAVTYQWKKDGANVGANSNKYTPAEAGSYTVTVSAAGYGSKTSAPVTVTLPNLGGTISISPTAATINTQLTANYSGSESVTYQWKKGETNVGANSNKYTPSEAGSYTVTVSASGYNSKTSAPVTVTLPNLPGTITISPTANVGTGTELTANYSGSQSVTYQWKKGETNVGTNSSTYTPTEAGSYTVTVSAAGYNSKTSAPVTVIVLPDLGGTVTISPNTGVTPGTELTANYSGSEAVTYQWKRNGANVGANNNKYTPSEAGSYTVTVSASGYASKTSAPVNVNVAGSGTLTIQITNLTPFTTYTVSIGILLLHEGYYTTADASGTITCTGTSKWEINSMFPDAELQIKYYQYGASNPPTKTAKIKYKLDDMPATFHGVNDFN